MGVGVCRLEIEMGNFGLGGGGRGSRAPVGSVLFHPEFCWGFCFLVSRQALLRFSVRRETSQDRLVASYVESEDMAHRRRTEEETQRQHLAVPRRPAWHSGMSVQELDAQERTSFLEWRRKLAK